MRPFRVHPAGDERPHPDTECNLMLAILRSGVAVDIYFGNTPDRHPWFRQDVFDLIQQGQTEYLSMISVKGPIN